MKQKGYWINDLSKTDNVKSYSENEKSLETNMIWIVVSVIVNGNSYSYRNNK